MSLAFLFSLRVLAKIVIPFDFFSYEISYTYMCVLSHFSCVWQFVKPWTITHQAPLSMGFLRQEYLSRLPCHPAGDLPDPGIKPMSFTSPALAGGFLTTRPTWEAPYTLCTLPYLFHYCLGQLAPKDLLLTGHIHKGPWNWISSFLLCLTSLTLTLIHTRLNVIFVDQMFSIFIDSPFLILWIFVLKSIMQNLFSRGMMGV